MTEPPTRRPHASLRLETLSDIVFGLAMTFLVSRLPTPSRSQPAPTWPGLAHLLGPHLFALTMSFFIAGLYWFGHHRRLALSPPPTTPEVVINFAFLFVVMLLPTTTDLYYRFGDAGSMTCIYCTQLLAMSSLHLLLWIITIHATRRRAGGGLPWRFAAGPAFGTAVFASAAAVALWRPADGGTVLLIGFLTPVVTRLSSGRLDSPDHQSAR